MNKTNNLRAYLRDLYEGIVSKKPDASRNPQNFRSDIEAIRTGGEFYEVMDASELPEDAPNGSLAIVEVEGGDDSTVGIWVFNKELTTPLDVVDTPEKFNHWDTEGFYHDLNGYVITPNGNPPIKKIECVLLNGEFYGDVYDNVIQLGEINGSIWYVPLDGGWRVTKDYIESNSPSIVITKEPSPKVAEWLRANAKKQAQSTAYIVSSVDELNRIDAVDGSMAIVENDSIKGIWSPIHNSLTPINKPFEEGWEDVHVPFIYASNFDNGETSFEIFQYSNLLTFIGDNTFIEEITASNCDSSNYDNVVMEQTIFYESWSLLSIEFCADTDDIAFKEWLNANFERHSGGYSLYTRENGEWVYKCEVV